MHELPCFCDGAVLKFNSRSSIELVHISHVRTPFNGRRHSWGDSTWPPKRAEVIQNTGGAQALSQTDTTGLGPVLTARRVNLVRVKRCPHYRYAVPLPGLGVSPPSLGVLINTSCKASLPPDAKLAYHQMQS